MVGNIESNNHRFVFFMLFIAALGLGAGWAQVSTEKQLSGYQKSFVKGSLVTKMQVLQDATKTNNAAMAPLYHQSLLFLLNNLVYIREDRDARELALLSIRLLGLSEYSQASSDLWSIFTRWHDPQLRVEALHALSQTAADQPDIIANINSWVEGQNSIYRKGGGIEKQVVKEAIIALGNISSPSSFQALFNTLVLDLDSEITEKAKTALQRIEGDYTSMVIKILRNASLEEKLSALRAGLSFKDIKTYDKARIAEVALNIALEINAEDSKTKNITFTMRQLSVKQLQETQWVSATPYVIKHFDLTWEEYENGQIQLDTLLLAIKTLESMQSHEAAVRLTLFLEVVNTYQETGKGVEKELVLQVIDSLVAMGDPIAFDHLLYARYLDYPEAVKTAATNGLNTLKDR